MYRKILSYLDRIDAWFVRYERPMFWGIGIFLFATVVAVWVTNADSRAFYQQREIDRARCTQIGGVYLTNQVKHPGCFSVERIFLLPQAY